MNPTSHSPAGTNPHTAQPTSLLALAKSLWRNRQLMVKMTKHEAIGRYRSSIMGWRGTFFKPRVSASPSKRVGGAGGEESKFICSGCYPEKAAETDRPALLYANAIISRVITFVRMSQNQLSAHTSPDTNSPDLANQVVSV